MSWIYEKWEADIACEKCTYSSMLELWGSSTRGLIAFRKSSKPSSLIVSGSALSVRHQGQFRDMPSSPRYHVSTHVSHPIIDLQQRAKMTGGQMGAVWQIWHLKLSIRSDWRATGIFIRWSIVKILCNWSCIARTSFFRLSNSAPQVFFCRGRKSSASLSETLSITWWARFLLLILSGSTRRIA